MARIQNVETARHGAPAIIIMFLACIGALYIAADIMIPIVLAVLINLLLAPLVRAGKRIGVPPALTALAITSASVLLLATLASALAGPAERWLAEAPKTLSELQQQLARSRDSFSEIRELAQEVDEMTAVDADPNAQQVVLKGPGVLESLLGGLPNLLSFGLIAVCLSFFLLASGDTLLRRATECGRQFSDRRRIVAAARQIQADVSRYLATVTAINTVLGILTALWMTALGVDNPVLWGAMVALMNFAPYVGAVVSALVLSLVGVGTFDTLTSAALVPAGFIVLTMLEGQLVTPAILGQRMALSPVFVFLSVVFWGWLWGAVGALMAVPITTALTVICEHVDSAKPLARFVRGDSAGPPVRSTNANAQRSAADL